MSGFSCQECGYAYRTAGAAERASLNGCPKCGATDVDVTPVTQRQTLHNRPQSPIGSQCDSAATKHRSANTSDSSEPERNRPY